MLAYIAGPLFNEGERWFVEKICAQAEVAGFETFLPHRDTPPEYVIPRNPAAIFRSDLDYLERAALVVANLNGITSDDGTAWELGYAYARGVHLVGIYTDLRLTFPGAGDQPDIGALAESHDALAGGTGGVPAALRPRTGPAGALLPTS